MSRPGPLTLLFAILFAVLFIGPALLSEKFGPYPLIKVGDVLDLFTPLILIPLYWVLLRAAGREPPGPRETLLFMVLAAGWVEGQGMHLSANSIGHLVEEFAGSDAQRLTHFYDEILSHYLWHGGIIGLAALVLIRHWRQPSEGPATGLALPTVAGAIHGLTYFIIVVEGGTALIGVPFALAVALGGVIWWRRRLRQRSIVAFFVVTCLVATLLFAGWAIYWGGLPQFSQVGIIE